MGAGRERETDRGARRSTALHVAVEVDAVGPRIARREDDVHDVILHLVVDVDVADDAARGDDVFGGDDRLHVPARLGDGHGVQNRALFGAVRIADDHLQHEAIDLRLGQRISAFLLERVLRRENEERIGQPISLVAERDLAFLHRFEQRALHFGGRAIDFVREDEVREDRAVLRAERAVARVVDHGADDVRREHVGRELQALEIQADRGGERLERERLREAGHAFEQDVAVADAGRP